jgi:hypothetical protein
MGQVAVLLFKSGWNDRSNPSNIIPFIIYQLHSPLRNTQPHIEIHDRSTLIAR